MFVKNKNTEMVFEITEDYYNEFLSKNPDLEVIEEPKKKAVKPTIVLGGE